MLRLVAVLACETVTSCGPDPRLIEKVASADSLPTSVGASFAPVKESVSFACSRSSSINGWMPRSRNAGSTVLVTAIKGGLGHTLGASGAMAAVAAIYALQAGLIPPTLNLDALDPDCGALQVVTGGPRRLGGGRVMVNAFGLGHNASVIARKFNG